MTCGKMQANNTIILLMGATAAGKTDYAVRMHDEFPVSIISVDSALIYKGMDIGTAKPDTKVLQRAPHRLISFLDPVESWSVGSFYQQVQIEIKEIHEQGKIPLLVGGTMMYFRVLQQGLAKLPQANAQVRAEIESKASKHGWASLHADLEKVDPDSARRIHINDPQRIQRALEVYQLSGRPLSDFLQQAKQQGLPYSMIKLVAGPVNRRDLDARIELRFNAMLENGFFEEVQNLQARGDLSLNMPSMRCVGYRQVWEYLLGGFSYEEMRRQAIKATRMLAKRQYTWLRSESDCHWIDTNKQQSGWSQIMTLMQKNIDFNSHN